MDCKERVKFLLITSNVGSLFEEFGARLRKNWIDQFEQLVSVQRPYFIALHLQEVGGKTHEVSKQEVQNFFKDVHGSDIFKDFHTIHGYIDEDYEQDKYTALGCIYLIHKSVDKLFELWDFTENRFSKLPNERNLHSISNTCFLKKYKFPLSCYSKKVQRWPRKGFTWTRWRFNNKVLDLMNIHLTHDASNIKAALKSPTVYAKHRRRSLDFALERLSDISTSDHQILFGDFNVRPDNKALIEYLMKDKAQQYTENGCDGEITSLVYKSINGSTTDLLKIGTRYFQLSCYDAFSLENVSKLLQFDKELEWALNDRFKEAPIKFRPTYPHTEEPDNEKICSFSTVRCPSWCDRVIVDTALYKTCVEGTSTSIYQSYGEGVQLGDHKPVYLLFEFP